MRFLRRKKKKIKKIFKFCIMGVLCFFILIIFSLTFFYFAGIGRATILHNIPNKIKDPIKILYYQGFKTVIRRVKDLPYIFYQFKSSDLPIYEIEIDTKDWKFLNNNLPTPDVPRMELLDEHKKYRPAKFKFNGKEYEVDVRYRGASPIHWVAFKKSWRIKFKKDDLFEGQKAINLIIPDDRHFYTDILNGYRAEKLGLKTQIGCYVILRINNKSFGPYYQLEHWGKDFLEKKDLPGDANLYGERRVVRSMFQNIFDWRKYSKDITNQFGNYAEIDKLIDLLNIKETSDEKFFKQIADFIDMDNFYKWQAQAVLAGSMHQNSGHNIMMYFNNTIGKFQFFPDEPSFYDIKQESRTTSNSSPFSIDYINFNPINTRIFRNSEFLYQRNKILWDYVKDDKNLEDDLRLYDKIYQDTRVAFYNDSTKAYPNSYFEREVKAYRQMIINNFTYLRNLFKIEEIKQNITVDNRKNIPISINLAVKSYSPVHLRDIDFTVDENSSLLDWLVYYDKNNNNQVNSTDMLLGKLKYSHKDKKYSFVSLNRVEFHTERDWTISGLSQLQEKDLLTTNHKLLIIPSKPAYIKNPKVDLTLTNSITGGDTSIR